MVVITAIHSPSLVLLRSLDAGFAQLLLGTVNLVRAERRHDLVLARICVIGNLCWLASTIAATVLLRPVATIPLLLQSVVCLVLLVLSMRSRKRSRPM